MSTKGRFWRPHFVTEKINDPRVGEIYVTGLREVFYEDEKPTLWSAKAQSVEIDGETFHESFKEAKGLLEIYENAKNNIHYFACQDEQKTPYLKPLHPEEFIQYDVQNDQYFFDYTDLKKTDEDKQDITLNLDSDVQQKLLDMNIDIQSPEGVEYLYSLIHDTIKETLENQCKSSGEQDCSGDLKNNLLDSNSKSKE